MRYPSEDVPVRPDLPETARVARGIAATSLALVFVGQVMFLSLGVVAMGLGGVGPWEFGLFVVVGGGVLWALHRIRVAVVRRRLRPRAGLFSVVAPVADLALYVVLTGGLLAGSCSEQEIRIIGEVPTFEGTDVEFEPQSGSCVGELDVTATADAVMDHYEHELEADGWRVVIEDVPAEGSDETFVVKDLIANRGDERYTISLESFSGRVTAGISIDA